MNNIVSDNEIEQENYISQDGDNDYNNRLGSIPRVDGISSYNHMNSEILRLGDLFSGQYVDTSIQIIHEN